MKLCIFIPFHINLTFSGINNPQQPRPAPAVGPLVVLPGEVDQHLLDGGDQGLHLVVRGPVTSLSEMPRKKLSFRLLSNELGGQTSSKPLSHGLPRVFIDWLLNNLQKLHFVGIAEAAVQLSSAFF